jgi:hypothetical protein
MTRVRAEIPRLRQPVAVGSTQGTLALDLTPRLDPPSVPDSASVLHGDVVPIDVLVRRELESWSRRYAQAVVEIVNGDRPVSQLVRWTSPRVHEELNRRAQIVARAGVHQAGLGRGRRLVVRPAVQNVRTCFISPGVAEVSVHVRYGERSRAIAARFERTQDRWICTALEFA